MEILLREHTVPSISMMSRRPVCRNIVPFFCMALIAGTGRADTPSPPTPEMVNAALGVPLFADENLWDEDGEDVAVKLDWPRESKTSTDSSWRAYPGDDVRFLGCRPRSMALYAEDGKPSSLSLIFANKGDGVSYMPDASNSRALSERQTQIREYKRSILNDKKTLAESLTALFGDPVTDRFGNSRNTREQVKRWDWNGHAFLLASPRDEYVALRIMPVYSADAGGKSRISDAEVKARVASRIERRENGDVILTGIPMVDQGPKGYCVPATWERVMRYMGVPADMYVLAMAGDTGAGGGTHLSAVTEGARESIVAAGRKIENPKMKIDTLNVSRFIDRGLPIMWTMFSTPQFNNAANARLKDRASVTDPIEWKKRLNNARRDGRQFRIDDKHSHVCMIIGYNKKTNEIAVSDSWGPEFAERWVTPEEASAISQDSFIVINF